jgi:hypothetical protein
LKRKVVMIPAVFAAAVLLAALQATTPPYAKLTGPISTVGRQGQTVSSDTFGVKVNRVLKAKAIGYDQFGRTVDLQSSGVWVVISAELQAFRKTMPVRAATLIGASGRMYRQSRRAGEAPNNLSVKTVQPGLPTTGLLLFELPEDELRDMKLVLSEQYDPQLKDEISVSLETIETTPQARLEIRKDGV